MCLVKAPLRSLNAALLTREVQSPVNLYSASLRGHSPERYTCLKGSKDLQYSSLTELNRIFFIFIWEPVKLCDWFYTHTRSGDIPPCLIFAVKLLDTQTCQLVNKEKNHHQRDAFLPINWLVVFNITMAMLRFDDFLFFSPAAQGHVEAVGEPRASLTLQDTPGIQTLVPASKGRSMPSGRNQL